VRNLLQGGFSGPIRLVNPNHPRVAGQTTYADASALPEAPDLAVVATPAATVPKIVQQLAARGAGAVVVITAGFGSDNEGAALTRQMLEAARPATLRIIGPNCLGFISPRRGINASFAHMMPAPGRLAFLAQSGAIITSIIDWAASRNIGFSHMVSMGELADVDFGDMLDWLATDPHTDAILLYIEAVTHARKFMSAARFAARVKPVIVIKAGRHAETARAVSSHTGALAGTDAVYDAAFRRAGMLRVENLDDLFAAAETLSMTRLPDGDRLAIVTNGGGLGILATDALIGSGGRLAPLAAATLSKLQSELPASWSRGNPVDIVGDATPERYRRTVETVLADDTVDGLLVLNCPTAISDGSDSARAVLAAAKGARIPVLTSWVGGTVAQQSRQLFAAHGLATYDTPERAAAAFMQLVKYRRNQAALLETPSSRPPGRRGDQQRAQSVLARALRQHREWLTGPECAEILDAYAIPASMPMAVADAAEAVRTMSGMPMPVVLKILSPDISHKSDVGGVALNLSTPQEVTAAADAMLARVARLRPDAHIDGFTLEPMIRRPHARELIVGISEDPQFGPVILFGQGGTAVELLQDRALGLPPLNMALARHQMGQTRIYRLLQGFRDTPAADLDAVADTLIKVAQLAIDLPEIVELDINPLLADENGVMALDARIRVAVPVRARDERLAIRPYPAELEQSVTIDDGRRLMLRPIRPEDEPQLQAAFKKLSGESVRLRFFSTMKDVPHYMAARLTQIDYEREMALILCEPDTAGHAEIYGVVRISADANNDRAEYAIVVRDDMAGHGLGTLLMNRIIEYARNRKINRLYGHVLAENSPMLDICRRLGFEIAHSSDEVGVMLVSLDLATVAPALQNAT
jgi:acetyltransferase